MNKINLLLGGPSGHLPSKFKPDKLKEPFIGVDRGSLNLISMGITPLLAVGDFDSLTGEEFKLLKNKVKDIRRSVPEKDDTDTELALKIALFEYKAKEVKIFAGTQGRLDHFLSNLFLPLENRFKAYADRIRIIDDQNDIRYFSPGNYKIEKQKDKKYLSFIPLTEMKLNLPNEKYKLNNYLIKHPMALVSNEFVGQQAFFSFDKGLLAVIQSKDKIKK